MLQSQKQRVEDSRIKSKEKGAWQSLSENFKRPLSFSQIRLKLNLLADKDMWKTDNELIPT